MICCGRDIEYQSKSLISWLLNAYEGDNMYVCSWKYLNF